MKILFALLCSAVLCGCNQKPDPRIGQMEAQIAKLKSQLTSGAPSSAQLPSEPVRWEYKAVKFHEMDSRSVRNNILVCYTYEGEFSGREMIVTHSNECPFVDGMLGRAGVYGWELIWTDRTNYIMKRPAGVWKNGNFFVGEAMIPVKSTTQIPEELVSGLRRVVAREFPNDPQRQELETQRQIEIWKKQNP